jgi:hypothetical protein
MFSDFQIKRIYKLIYEYINRFKIELKDLVVFTEVGSDYYLFTPIICSLAGAQKVFAITRDSRWGKAADIEKQLFAHAEERQCESPIQMIRKKSKTVISKCDIVMNSGFVRPIDEQMISWMKPTAVVPLMWETWESCEGDIDLQECRNKGILVMGTHEHTVLDRAPNNGYLAMQLLAAQKIEIHKNRIFVFASGHPADGINRVFCDNHVDYRWTTFDKHIQNEYRKYFIAPNEKDLIIEYIAAADALVCYEHVHNQPIIGTGGVLEPEELKEVNPDVLFVYISGKINYDRMKDLNIAIYPDIKQKFGKMTVGTYELGPRSPLELNCAGIKVGEAMARARLAGMSIEHAKEYAQKHSLAMDFEY